METFDSESYCTVRINGTILFNDNNISFSVEEYKKMCKDLVFKVESKYKYNNRRIQIYHPKVGRLKVWLDDLCVFNPMQQIKAENSNDI